MNFVLPTYIVYNDRVTIVVGTLKFELNNCLNLNINEENLNSSAKESRHKL